MGPILACPSAAGEYTAFLRMIQYVNRAPQTQPETIATKNVTIVHITATSLMVRETSSESAKSLSKQWRLPHSSLMTIIMLTS